METPWKNVQYESESESESEDNTPPNGLDEEFCRCIQTIKWNMYYTTVMGPELNTPEAQQNELIQTYATQLGKLYDVMENALKEKIPIESDLRLFPEKFRKDIGKCAEWVVKQIPPTKGGQKNVAGERTRLSTNLSHTDIVPYKDYLNTTLRVYPFVHHMRMLGGADDIETL